MQTNSHINLKITERILLFIESKGITKYRFHKDLGLSNGFLDKKRDIGTDKYANILEYLPEVNHDWLLTGRGEMYKKDIVQEDTIASKEETNCKELTIVNKYLKEQNENLKTIINSNNEIIAFLKEGKTIKKTSKLV